MRHPVHGSPVRFNCAEQLGPLRVLSMRLSTHSIAALPSVATLPTMACPDDSFIAIVCPKD
jgi:hypothetical protein